MSIYTGNSEEIAIALIPCGECQTEEHSQFEYYINDYALYLQFDCPECGNQYNRKLIFDEGEDFTFETNWKKDLLVETMVSRVYEVVLNG